jgi:hypothetical protein
MKDMNVSYEIHKYQLEAAHCHVLAGLAEAYGKSGLIFRQGETAMRMRIEMLEAVRDGRAERG